MRIKEKIIEIKNPQYLDWNSIYSSILNSSNLQCNDVLKINLVKATKEKLFFNLVYIVNSKFKPFLDEPYSGNLKLKKEFKKDILALIVPTGIGAYFGGFAGDANSLAKLFSLKSKFLLSHPNVINGSVLSHPPDNLINLEGYFLNQFLLGQIKIKTNFKNKIGVIFDKNISKERILYEINVLNACKAFYGAEIIGYTVTDKPLNVQISVNNSFSSGNLENIECLISSALKLKSNGATSLAICSSIPDLDLNPLYSEGIGIDPIGGVESIISHLVSLYTGLVSANAPVLTSKEIVNYKNISPISASEYISETFLPSVINGLRYAPKIFRKTSTDKTLKSYNNVSEIIIPSNAFGSPGVIFQNNISNNITLINENKTSLNVSLKHIRNKFKLKKTYREYFADLDLILSKCSSEIFKRPISRVKNII